jgi:hypothetical protein
MGMWVVVRRPLLSFLRRWVGIEKIYLPLKMIEFATPLNIDTVVLLFRKIRQTGTFTFIYVYIYKLNSEF